MTVTTATATDAKSLAAVKPNYGTEEVAERLRWMEEDVDGTWFLLKQNQDIVAWCVAVWSGKNTHPEYPDMQDLFVRPEQRRRGYGSLLVSEIELVAKGRGHTKVGLAVNPDDNPMARRLYERLGYRHDGGTKYLDGIYDGNEDWVIDLEKDIF